MLTTFSHLAKPFGYLFIKGIGGKAAYDWAAPTGLTLLTAAYFCLFNITPAVLLSDSGFVKTVTSFISNLPGFYIAALAAIATFNREQIDHPLISNTGTPSIDVKVTKENGRVINSQEPLTRRLFLCMLFAFLTALSIIIVMLNALVAPLFTVHNNIYFQVIYLLLFTFSTWQLLVSTFFGLYYLGSRIHLNY
ncbi:hypothetical protein R1917_09720 [Citrobacter koseri]|uniref:hypothetical protein n=1 Tax=Citrobacter koseri TaxID=545 RepID=UPI0019044C26|nr:hypothetical protein [Citrobacter koseri]MBJ9281221.1 hypothetical protein [Citrobacter koseri]WOJ32586.1 hypothetical protein R1917_09720 [Citrobacter koseri]WOJ36759.1 hypothetical protein R1243_07265 [Citrobacter koseri]HEM8686258.1 hypothetical protein [Citrobacter koseri]